MRVAPMHIVINILAISLKYCSISLCNEVSWRTAYFADWCWSEPGYCSGHNQPRSERGPAPHRMYQPWDLRCAHYSVGQSWYEQWPHPDPAEIRQSMVKKNIRILYLLSNNSYVTKKSLTKRQIKHKLGMGDIEIWGGIQNEVNKEDDLKSCGRKLWLASSQPYAYQARHCFSIYRNKDAAHTMEVSEMGLN